MVRKREREEVAIREREGLPRKKEKKTRGKERRERKGKKKRKERKERKKERKKEKRRSLYFFLFWSSHFGIKVGNCTNFHPIFCN